MPTPDGGDDLVRVLGPVEGTRVGIGVGEEAVDSGLERDEGMEDAALEAPLGEMASVYRQLLQGGTVQTPNMMVSA